MFPEPLRDDGLKETKIAYDAKRLWAIIKYQDTYNEITFDYFIHNFEEMVSKASFNWEHTNKDGTPKYPNPNTAKDWCGKYDWKGCKDFYEDKKLNHSKKNAQKIYDKKYESDTITDFKTIDSNNERIATLKHTEKITGEDNTYRIAKLEEMNNSIWNRIRERLGLNKEVLDITSNNFNTNTNTTVPYEEMIEKEESFFKALYEDKP